MGGSTRLLVLVLLHGHQGARGDEALDGAADYVEIWPAVPSEELRYTVDTAVPTSAQLLLVDPPAGGIKVGFSWRGNPGGSQKQRPALVVRGSAAGLHLHLRGLDGPTCATLAGWSRDDRLAAARSLQRRLCLALEQALGPTALPGFDRNCTQLLQLAAAPAKLLDGLAGTLGPPAAALAAYAASDVDDPVGGTGPPAPCDRLLRLPVSAAAGPASFFAPGRVRRGGGAAGGYVQPVLDNHQTGRRRFWNDGFELEVGTHSPCIKYGLHSNIMARITSD